MSFRYATTLPVWLRLFALVEFVYFIQILLVAWMFPWSASLKHASGEVG